MKLRRISRHLALPPRPELLSRQPTAIDLAGAGHQGELIASTAIRLFN